MTWLLRSPWHGIITKDFMLVTVMGRKSGKACRTPVNYSHEIDARPHSRMKIDYGETL
jgi:hypothetical protein